MSACQHSLTTEQLKLIAFENITIAQKLAAKLKAARAGNGQGLQRKHIYAAWISIKPQ